METDKYVQILLSTYNGEKYLREQLDSFIAQTYYSNIKVLIRDDGSTDGTQEILQKYSEKYGFEVMYGENVGINASYEILLQVSDSTCHYFAFSDQDDVWLPEKIELSVRHLDQVSEMKPALFFSLSYIVNEYLEIISKSHVPKRGISFYNAMVQNICPGHTQVFNLKMRNLLLEGNCTHAHVLDWWVYLVASGLGQICFEPQCTVLHRQHSKNAVGYEMNMIRKMYTRWKRLHSHEASAISRQLVYFLEDYAKRVPNMYKNEVEAFLQSQDSWQKRLSYIIHCQIFRQTYVDNVLVRLLYLLGKYRVNDGELC